MSDAALPRRSALLLLRRGQSHALVDFRQRQLVVDAPERNDRRQVGKNLADKNSLSTISRNCTGNLSTLSTSLSKFVIHFACAIGGQRVETGMDNVIAPQQTRKITSSPRFPSMSLEAAIEKARIIWDKEAKHPTGVPALAVHWNLSEKSSSLRSYLAALGHFGLLEQVGGQGSGEYKLTDRAIAIMIGDAKERAQAIREAALEPRVYRELMQRFNGELPSDENLRSRLVIDFQFNKDSVAGFLKDFRATLALAKLDNAGESSVKNENSTAAVPRLAAQEAEKRDATKIEQPINLQKPSLPASHLTTPPMTANLRYLPIPLDIGDAPIPVGMSEDDFTLLIATLNLWKRKIVRAINSEPVVRPEYPKQAVWKNKDTDMPVTITGVMGERDGALYYQSSTGTGIPASELEFMG